MPGDARHHSALPQETPRVYEIAGELGGYRSVPRLAHQDQHTSPFSCSAAVPPRCPQKGSMRLRSLKMNRDDKRNRA